MQQQCCNKLVLVLHPKLITGPIRNLLLTEQIVISSGGGLQQEVPRRRRNYAYAPLKVSSECLVIPFEVLGSQERGILSAAAGRSVIMPVILAPILELALKKG